MPEVEASTAELRRMGACRVTVRFSLRVVASVSEVERQTTGLDDEHVRRGRLLLLGKGAVSAPRLERPFTAGMDESEQRPTHATRAEARLLL
jgi:hypothetical protein